MYTVPVHDIWYTVSVYNADDASVCIDAFTKWQEDASSDTNSTVAMIIGLDIITIGLLYSETAVPKNVFAAFDKLPTPLAVAVPPTIGTVHSLTQKSAATSSLEPMR